MLHKLEIADYVAMQLFKGKVSKFYSICIDYLDKLDYNLKDLQLFSWILLDEKVDWDRIQQSCFKFKEFISKSKQSIDIDILFDEYSAVESFVTIDKIEE